MAKKYMKKDLTSLAIREMQIQTTLRFYFTPIRMALDLLKLFHEWGRRI
jgi:hypothetical protein